MIVLMIYVFMAPRRVRLLAYVCVCVLNCIIYLYCICDNTYVSQHLYYDIINKSLFFVIAFKCLQFTCASMPLCPDHHNLPKNRRYSFQFSYGEQKYPNFSYKKV